MSGMTNPTDIHGSKFIPSDHLFIAQVVDNNDPAKQQRLRITVPNLVEGETAALPWAIPMGRSSGADNVELDVPDVGSYVIVMFQKGDTNFPVWFGGLHANYTGSSTITGTNYPNRIGRQTQATTYWYVDKTTNQVHICHGTTTVTINSNGSINVSASNQIDITAAGTVNITASGNVNINAPQINLN